MQSEPASNVPADVPPDHPALPESCTGVLISNLGTPDGHGYLAMRKYLSEFLSDRRVIDYPPLFWQPLLQLVILTRRPFSSGRAYRSIWNTEEDESPLRTITRDQVEMLQERLQGRAVVDYAMRYGNPSIESRVAEMVENGCRRLLFFPLYPQYSATTTATAVDQLCKTMTRLRWQPSIRVVPPYHDHPAYIDALVKSVVDALGGMDFEPQRLVLSYHGLPQRYLELGDPYHCHCQKTSRLLREKLGWDTERVDTCFQSVFGKEEWLKPYTVEHVARLASDGIVDIAMMAPGFSSDCVETLEEIQEEIRDAFVNAGGRNFAYIPCLNASIDHIDMLERVTLENLVGWV